jgi:thiol-disulfide isomerase/thioredoxin
MNFKTSYTLLKKYAANILMVGFAVIMVFVPGTKSWVLQQLVSVGLFKASIDKEGVNAITPEKSSFSYTDAAGNAANTAGLKGKVVFINFWASWCPPCQAEMPSLQGLYNKLKDDNRFVFLFINEDEDKEKATAYLKKNNYTFPVYSTAGPVPNEIYSGSLPTTIVLDKDGKVVLKKEGMAGYDTEAFIQQLKDLL